MPTATQLLAPSTKTISTTQTKRAPTHSLAGWGPPGQDGGMDRDWWSASYDVYGRAVSLQPENGGHGYDSDDPRWEMPAFRADDDDDTHIPKPHPFVSSNSNRKSE